MISLNYSLENYSSFQSSSEAFVILLSLRFDLSTFLIPCWFILEIYQK